MEQDLKVILDKYAEWLNQWDDYTEKEKAQMREDLLRFSFIRAVIPTSWYTIYIVRADYGDDGGPAELIAFMEPDYLVDQPTIATLVQSFDTYTQVIYDTTMKGIGNG